MPVLAVGEGLFLLNEAFGGNPPEVLSTECCAHGAASEKAGAKDGIRFARKQDGGDSGSWGLLSPRRRRGLRRRLMDSHRAPRLLASAYDVEDGAVEGLESAEHDWVIGFRADLSADEKAAARLQRNLSGVF